MATKFPALESPSREGTTNVLRSDCTSADDLGCLEHSSNTFTLDFCNIRGLRSNFQSVEHHISFTKPHLLFVTETQVLLLLTTALSLFPLNFSILIFKQKLAVEHICVTTFTLVPTILILQNFLLC